MISRLKCLYMEENSFFKRLAEWFRSILEALFTPEGFAQLKDSARGAGGEAGSSPFDADASDPGDGPSGPGAAIEGAAAPSSRAGARGLWDEAGGRTMGLNAERRRILFFGRVQGVGFRYCAMNDARALDLTGWVENLDDGSVRMEVQGLPAAIDYLLSNLETHRWIHIEQMQSQYIPPVEGERGFRVRGY